MIQGDTYKRIKALGVNQLNLNLGGLCNAPATPDNGFRNCRRVNNPDKIQFVCHFGCNDVSYQT